MATFQTAVSMLLLVTAILLRMADADSQPITKPDPELSAAHRLPEAVAVNLVQPDSYPADRLAELKQLKPETETPSDASAAEEVGAAAAVDASHFWPPRRPRPHYPHHGNKYRKPLYLYNWCGLAIESTSTNDKDFIATIDATPGSATFGQLVSIVDSPYARTEAHHCGVDRSGKWFGAGGLLSFLQKETDGSPLPEALFFDLSNPKVPKYSHGLYTPNNACTDEFRSTPDGGFAVSSMCNRSGTTGGGWFKVAPDMRSLREFVVPKSLPANEYMSANPHGIDFDVGLDLAVTSDFIDVASTIITDPNNPPTPIVQSTVRVWQYSTGKYLKTFDVGPGNYNGMMDTRRMPNPHNLRSRRGLFSVTNGLGHLWMIDAYGNRPPTRVYCALDDCADLPGSCIQSNPFKKGTRMLVASYALDQVRLLDITDPYKMKALDILQMPKGAGGHVVKYDEETSIGAISTYFLDIKGTVLRYNADQKVSLFYVDLKTDKMKLLGAVDFTTAVKSKGPSNCHGAAFSSYYEY